MVNFLQICLIATFLSIAVSEDVRVATATRDVAPAVVSSSSIPAIIGLPVNISCSSGGRPVKFCRWERQPPPHGKRYIVTIKDAKSMGINQTGNNEDSFKCNCTYDYIGQGLDKGDCSISISNVSDFHIAKWECTLAGQGDHTWIGSLNVTRSVDKPYFKEISLLNGLFFNETFPANNEVTCCVNSYNHNLPVSIDIYLENDKDIDNISDGNSSKRDQKLENSSLRGEQVCRQFKHTFRPEDNGKRLVCLSSFRYQSQEHKQTTIFPVDVKYCPMLQSDTNFTQHITDNNSLMINVTFRVNPPGNASWILEYDPATGATFEIREDHVKYKTNLQHLMGDNYAATLEIVDLQSEDYRREFHLTLLNEYGSRNVSILLISSPDESETYWIPILTGIAIITFLIVIAAIFFTLIRRRVKGKYVPTNVTFSVDNDNL